MGGGGAAAPAQVAAWILEALGLLGLPLGHGSAQEHSVGAGPGEHGLPRPGCDVVEVRGAHDDAVRSGTR